MSSEVRLLPALFVLSSLLAPNATAAELVVQSTVAAEVLLGDLRIAQTYGPGQVRVPDLPAGEQTFVVSRAGYPVSFTLVLPETGEAWLRIGEQGISSDVAPLGIAPSEEPVGPPPRVELRAVSGRGFTVILDGEPQGELGKEEPVVFEDLSPGRHELQLRSLDRTIIWARGTLDLHPGDRIVLHVREGRTLEVFGRPEAWQDER